MDRTIDTAATLAALETASEKTARALLRRTDIKVVSAGNAAHYNWAAKVLHVPAYSVRDDACPEHVWAWRGLLDHECAHVEFTDGDVYDRHIAIWRDELGDNAASRIMLIANAFEDWLIERLWIDMNPGARRHLEETEKLVIRETGGAGPCDPNYIPEGGAKPIGMIMALVQGLIRVECGQVAIEECSPAVQQLIALLVDEVEQGRQATSSEEVCLAARAVWEKLVDAGESEDADGSEGSEAGDNPEGSEGSGGSEDSEGSGGSEGSEGSEGSGGSEAGDNPEDSEGDANADGGGGSRGGDDGDNSEGSGGSGASGGDDNPTDSEASGGSTPGGGVGAGVDKVVIDASKACVGGEYGELENAAEIVAKLFEADPSLRPYTVHPEALEADRWIRFTPQQRAAIRLKSAQLREACGADSAKMANFLRTAVKSQQRTLWVGGLEEGEELDLDALPGVASGRWDGRIFADKFSEASDNTFVTVLVDCSGSMGNSAPRRKCPTHGYVNQKGDRCSRKDSWSGKRCNEKLITVVTSKSGYAAMTAMTLHDALRSCGVQHAVLGYSNEWTGRASLAIRDAVEAGQPATIECTWEGKTHKYPRWSRSSTALVTYEFVQAPGLSDDGTAIGYIDGQCANLDGESVIEAAKYMVKHQRDCTRLVMIVVADGAPSGADDGGIEARHLADCVERVACAGIEVYGIGVGLYDRAGFTERYYPSRPACGDRAATGSVTIPSGQGITGAVMRQLTDLLVKSNGRVRR